MKIPQDTKPSKDRFGRPVHISEVLKKIIKNIGDSSKKESDK